MGATLRLAIRDGNNSFNIDWQEIGTHQARQFVCGHCSHSVTSQNGYFAIKNPERTDKSHWFIIVCHNCGKPTFFSDEDDHQVPGPAIGEPVDSLPDDVGGLYAEARNACKVGAYTASVLCSRKLLMNVAVSKGAEEGEPFIDYVNYLADAGYVPPDGKSWVDHIRKKGNEATHEISIMGVEDAADLITFAGMLLKFIYEFPARINPPASAGGEPETDE